MEIEKRVAEDELAEEALEFFSSDLVSKKMRWYYEKNLSGNSFEAKFKYDKRKYSVEFDTTGEFRDLEIEIREKEIPDSIYREVIDYIDENYDQFKIEKVQLQYNGSFTSFDSFINQIKSLLPYYEIVAKTRKNNVFLLREFVFNEKGKLMTDSEKVTRNTDNLEY